MGANRHKAVLLAGGIVAAIGSASCGPAPTATRIASLVSSGTAVTFPAGFWWGAATAAHQVEGDLNNDWKAFEAVAGNVRDGDTSKIGVDHYKRFDADFTLAQEMGHNVHRLSIEWSRLQPTRGSWDATASAHYHDVFNSLKSRGLRPLVTLHHFTNPIWVADQGGWLTQSTQTDFADFASRAGKEFGAEVDDWITINEPNVYAFKTYDEGAWPPKHKNREEALQVMANLAKSHAAAYSALHAADQQDADGDGEKVRVGIAQHIAIFDPNAAWSPIDVATAYFNDLVFNRAFLKAVTSGDLDFSIPGVKGVSEKVPGAVNALDFIGVNYYTRWLCKGSDRLAKPESPKNALGWEIYPEGLYRALKLANDYSQRPDGKKIPLYVTENGIDDRTGTARSPYLVNHLAEVAHAIQDGVDVKGYIHWTLLDNFEWSDGYAPRFGLYGVDRTEGQDLKRTPTPTVEVFKTIAKANAVSTELLKEHGK